MNNVLSGSEGLADPVQYSVDPQQTREGLHANSSPPLILSIWANIATWRSIIYTSSIKSRSAINADHA